MSGQPHTRRRNLCGCTACVGESGTLHGTQERARTCQCTQCAAAVQTLVRLRAYTGREGMCGVPVIGAGNCYRTPNHPLPHMGEQAGRVA